MPTRENPRGVFRFMFAKLDALTRTKLYTNTFALIKIPENK